MLKGIRAISAAGVITVALMCSAPALADAPQELAQEWGFCAGGGTWSHPHESVKKWKLDESRFSIEEETFGDEEYFLDVPWSPMHPLQDMTWHIVRGDSGALPIPMIKQNEWCAGSPKAAATGAAAALGSSSKERALAALEALNASKPLSANAAAAPSYTYMLSITELENNDGSVSPHLLVLVPLLIGDNNAASVRANAFVFGVVHLCAISWPLCGTKPDTDTAAVYDTQLAESLGKVTPEQFLELLLRILTHNGVVHGEP